jgi:hypothetical protein
MRKHREEKKRGVVTRRRRAVMLLATEGKNKTEKNYFTHLGVDQKYYAIHFVPGNDTDPESMTANIKKQIEKMEFKHEDGDQAFCILDLDADAGKANLVRRLMDETGTDMHGYIISNPCFEVWYLAHFGYSTKHHSTAESVIKELKKHIPDYTKSKDVYAQISPNTAEAISNAKKLKAYHRRQQRLRGDVLENPVTEVDIIVELLLGN